MDHVNVNRVSLTALGAVLFVMLLTAFSNLVMSPRTPKVPGFALPTAAPATASAPAPAAAPEEPLPALLAKADPKRGQELTKVCQVCHTFNKGEPNKIGPNLWGITEEAMAEVPGYKFSAAMEAHKGEKWDPEKLNEWLWKPQAFIKGTKMTFAGIPKGQDRADVIAYLETLK